VDVIDAEVAALPPAPAPSEDDIRRARIALFGARQAADVSRAASEAARAKLDEVRGALAALRQERETYADVAERIAAAEREVARCAWLRKEIQRLITLLVEAAAPGLTARLNEFLGYVFADRFSVRVEPMSDNATTEGQSKTYRIYVTDADSGEERILETLSGGEYSPVLQGIQFALRIYANEHGLYPWLTTWIDEADAPLRDMTVEHWQQMLAAVHESEQFHQIWVVSHRGHIPGAKLLDMTALPRTKLAASGFDPGAPAEDAPVEADNGDDEDAAEVPASMAAAAEADLPF
jgi:DNA repair exonuclease SbcCD ATPase subunit